MPNENAQGKGKGLDDSFDPKAQAGMNANGGQSDWGKGRGRADVEEKGDRSADAPKNGLGRDRADEEDTSAEA